MAWNEPGGSGGRGPWGDRRRSDRDPMDLEEYVRRLQRKLSGLFGGRGGGDGGLGMGKGGGFGAGLIAVVVVALWLLSGFYIVQQGERGVVLRFGENVRITEAGLRWHLPYPIERVEKVNVEKVSTIEIGYRSHARTGTRAKVPKEALMLTGDENIIDIEFAVQYRIKDAAHYLFNVRDVETTIAQATESAVREIVGNSTLEFALTEGRDQISRSARELLQKILDRYESGIHIVTVETQRAQPPEEVRAAFDDAVKAREDQQRLINEAEAYANDVIPRARGAAARQVEEAEAYRARVIARAEGEAQRFRQVAEAYAQAPAVTRERLYLETMEQVLSNATTILIDQKGGNNILYLPLDRLVPPPGVPGMLEASPSPAESGAGPARAETPARDRVDLRRREARP